MSIDFKILTSSVIGFTLALSWNTAASKALQYYFPHENEVFQYFICTIILTLIIFVLVALYNKTVGMCEQRKGGSVVVL